MREILVSFVEAKDMNFDLFYYLGEASKNINQYEEAIYYYQNALSYRGNVIEILNSIGTCYLEIQNKGEALEAFEKSLEVNPNQETIKKIVEELKKK